MNLLKINEITSDQELLFQRISGPDYLWHPSYDLIDKEIVLRSCENLSDYSMDYLLNHMFIPPDWAKVKGAKDTKQLHPFKDPKTLLCSWFYVVSDYVLETPGICTLDLELKPTVKFWQYNVKNL